MKKEKPDVIEKACQAVIDEKYQDQLLIHWAQEGSTT